MASSGMTYPTRRLADTISAHDGSDPETRTMRRLALSRAITLMESQSASDMKQANLLLNHLTSQSNARAHAADRDGRSFFRVGIAGPPGAGKSTLIEKFGLYILDKIYPQSQQDSSSVKDGEPNSSSSHHPIFAPSKLAVVCIDPSSTLSGGSILGDKTRMAHLSRHSRAFVRPSPSRGALGGISAYTDDVVSLCQFCGYDLVVVETVGLGQAEVEISEGVDMLILIVPPGGGDELQGIKKGIVELSDMLVVNKADGVLLAAAQTTAADYRGAMSFLRQRMEGWEKPPVLLVSAKTGNGMDILWNEICRFREVTISNGELMAKRQRQATYWMWKHVRDLIMARTKSDPILRERAAVMKLALQRGQVSPRVAASEMLDSVAQTTMDEMGEIE